MNILHRDLTPVNILFDNRLVFNSLKQTDLSLSIADFGLSIFIEDLKQDFAKCGTPGYMAPESIKDGDYSERSDIFSVGCLLYRMLTGENLFQGVNP